MRLSIRYWLNERDKRKKKQAQEIQIGLLEFLFSSEMETNVYRRAVVSQKAGSFRLR
jgi:hypothetical protein